MANAPKTPATRAADGTIKCDQPMTNGWYITYNPDDDRLYVANNGQGVASATFTATDKGLANARNWAKTHTA